MRSHLADCQQCEIEAAADQALATGLPVVAAGVCFVPDVLVIEALANGQETPLTWRLRSPDGREVWLYQTPVCVAL